MVTSGECLVENARFGVTFGESLVENARFGSLDCHFGQNLVVCNRSVKQEFRARASRKSVKKECQAKASSKIV